MESKVTITGEGLANLLKDFNKKSFVSLHTVTEPKLNKKGRVSGLSVLEMVGAKAENIRKVSDMVVGLGYDYQDLVLNRLINKAGKDFQDYQPGESWHIPWEKSTTVHMHKTTGEKYFFVECIANNDPKSCYVDISTGAELSKEKLEEFLPKDYPPKNQGLDKGVRYSVTLRIDGVDQTFYFDSTSEMEVFLQTTYPKAKVIEKKEIKIEPVLVRTFKLESIKRLKVGGTIYEVLQS